MPSAQFIITGKDEECALPSEGQQDTKDITSTPARRKWIIFVGLAVLALIVGGLGGVIGGFIVRATVQDDDDADDSTAQVQPDNNISKAELLGFLEQHSPALSDPMSPQSHAFEWLLRDLASPGAVLATNQSKLQRYALATLYYSTNGDGWTKPEEFGCRDGVECGDENEDDTGLQWPWLTLDHECTWGGVSCNFDDSISSIWLPRIHMSGPIPTEISLLSTLASLFLGLNQLSSSIPSELGLLTKLHTLHLLDNHLAGVIPNELGRLTRLVELSLAQNKISGTIPTEFGLLTSIETMDLKDNLLNGDIPSELGMMRHATYLELFGNAFVGATVPSEVCELQNLELNTDCGDVRHVVCCCCEMCCQIHPDGWGCSSFNPCDPIDYENDDDPDLPSACSVCLL